jgi:L-seryl-tRNA(Ser) seleniumtransferase
MNKKKSVKESPLRQIPSVDKLISSKRAEALIGDYGRSAVVEATRKVLKERRLKMKRTKESRSREKEISQEAILKKIKEFLKDKMSPSLTKAINATGVILHTGLGRAVLPREAQSGVKDVIEGYCTLATDIETGQRGHRDIHLNDLLCELTGAEAANVVNNNAAATMLILNTLAKGKEVIVSRGQLVEIGGSFRLPEVMEASGAVLKEVGTTNKTHLRDYTAAISEETGAIMRVHHSNYRILGFTEEPSAEELAELARKHNIPFIDDLGSGALVDLKDFGIETEPLVQRSIKAGVDVTCFSGDKLIGGPQAGIIVGKASIIQRIRKNPLSRALRVGKLTIAAMEATLRLFLSREKLHDSHPVYRMLSLSLKKVEKRAQKVAKELQAHISDKVEITIIDGGSQVGSGSVPVETIPTKLLRIKSASGSAENLARKLRHYKPPIFTRIQKDAVLFDFRTIQEDEDTLVAEALLGLLKKGRG